MSKNAGSDDPWKQHPSIDWVNTTCPRKGRMEGWKDVEVNKEIVNFAYSQISGIDENCDYIRTKNFEVQVSSNLV